MTISLEAFYKGKRVLVTGGSGLIGLPLVKRLLDLGAYVSVVTLDPDERLHAIRERENLVGVDWFKADLTSYKAARNVAEGHPYVFQLAGSKGSTGIGVDKGATFFYTHMSINLNMLKAAMEARAERYLLTSTVGVYPPAEVYYEDEAWSGPPNKADVYSAWAKRMAELFAEAVSKEYKHAGIVITRPGNCYGEWDDFNPKTAMAIAALIGRAVSGENPLKVWGDGSAVRDFTYADDVALGMLQAMALAPAMMPVNLSCGVGYSVKDAVTAVLKSLGRPITDAKFDASQPTGSPSRLLSIERAKSLFGFAPATTLEEGIRKTVEWYVANQDVVDKRYNPFLER